MPPAIDWLDNTFLGENLRLSIHMSSRAVYLKGRGELGLKPWPQHDIDPASMYG